MTKYRIVKQYGASFPYSIQKLIKYSDDTDYWQFEGSRKYLWKAKLLLKEIIKEEKLKKLEQVVVYEV